MFPRRFPRDPGETRSPRAGAAARRRRRRRGRRGRRRDSPAPSRARAPCRCSGRAAPGQGGRSPPCCRRSGSPPSPDRPRRGSGACTSRRPPHAAPAALPRADSSRTARCSRRGPGGSPDRSLRAGRPCRSRSTRRPPRRAGASPPRGGRTGTCRSRRERGRAARLERTPPGSEEAKGLERPHQLAGRDLLVCAVRVAGRTRSEVDGIQACLGELCHRCPGLLRPHGEPARFPEPGHERPVEDDVRRRRVAEDLYLPVARQFSHPGLGLLARAAGRIAVVQPGHAAVGDDVVGDPALDRDCADDLTKDEPVDLDVERLERRQGRQGGRSLVDRVIAGPWSGRVRADSSKCQLGAQIADAAEVELVVRGLEHDHELRLERLRARRQELRHRALVRRQLLAREEEETEVQLELPGQRPVGQLEHHRNAALHVARAEADHGAVLDSPGEIVLRGHRVDVPGEQDERPAGLSLGRCEENVVARPDRFQWQLRAHIRHPLSLGAADRRDVDEGERTLGQPSAWLPVPHMRILPFEGHNLCVTLRQPDPEPGAEPERGFVVAVLAQGVDADRELGELQELARTAGVEPVGELVQRAARPQPRTYVGKGKLVELKEAFARSGAESLLVDDELSPVQQRELENALQARVIDRTQLILDIFAQHAVTAEGKLQVELAQLEYNLPRMRGLWQHLERLGGGLGTRGPGESQLETDRRLARRRITVLRGRLRGLERQRDTRRKSRRRSETPVIALAGYTNAGNFLLVTALTGADVSVRDRLFETLDPTTRSFEVDGRKYLLTDTVGFIRRLPHQLVEGFAATLEETLVADLVLHVVDGSASDVELDEMRSAVEDVLAEIGVTDTPVELVLNKVDLVDPLRRRRLANRYPDALQERIAAEFGERFESVRMLLPYDEGARLAELYALGAPIQERVDQPDGVFVRAHLPRRELPRFAPYLLAEARDEPARSAK